MIQVICTDISRLTEADYRRLYDRASPERRARADRCRRQENALCCVVPEALLRFALGTDSFSVEKAPGGKPFFPDRPDIRFNISHSGSKVVLAIGDREVGVDVERHREKTDVSAIARRFFHPEELAYMEQSPERLRQRFYEIWTGKESYVKFLGTGLQKDLRSFSIFAPEPGLMRHYLMPEDGYSLSIFAPETDFQLLLLDGKQLL